MYRNMNLALLFYVKDDRFFFQTFVPVNHLIVRNVWLSVIVWTLDSITIEPDVKPEITYCVKSPLLTYSAALGFKMRLDTSYSMANLNIM